MIDLKLELPEKLEQHLEYLTIISKRSKEFILKEALIRYLEDAEDIAKVFEREKQTGGSTYTTEELLQHLNLKEVNV